MKYIGSRTAIGCLETDLGTKYFTSSNYVNWTKDEFKILEIIKCASNHDAIILEEIIIRENNAVFDDSFYNKHHQNIGFHGSVNKGKKHSKELRKIRSDALKKARKNKKNWYNDQNTQYEISRKGGLVQGKKNAKTSHLKDIATEYWRKVKSGEIEREKRIVIHNVETLENKTIPVSQEIPVWLEERQN